MLGSLGHLGQEPGYFDAAWVYFIPAEGLKLWGLGPKHERKLLQPGLKSNSNQLWQNIELFGSWN